MELFQIILKDEEREIGYFLNEGELGTGSYKLLEVINYLNKDTEIKTTKKVSGVWRPNISLVQIPIRTMRYVNSDDILLLNYDSESLNTIPNLAPMAERVHYSRFNHLIQEEKERLKDEEIFETIIRITTKSKNCFDENSFNFILDVLNEENSELLMILRQVTPNSFFLFKDINGHKYFLYPQLGNQLPTVDYMSIKVGYNCQLHKGYTTNSTTIPSELLEANSKYEEYTFKLFDFDNYTGGISFSDSNIDEVKSSMINNQKLINELKKHKQWRDMLNLFSMYVKLDKKNQVKFVEELAKLK